MTSIFKPPPITQAQRIVLVLEDGELVYDTDLKQIFTGDGVTLGGKTTAGTAAPHTHPVSDIDDYDVAPSPQLIYENALI